MGRAYSQDYRVGLSTAMKTHFDHTVEGQLHPRKPSVYRLLGALQAIRRCTVWMRLQLVPWELNP